MASRKKEGSQAAHELRRLQALGAERMEENFNSWVLDNHVWMVELVLTRAAEEKQTVEEAAYGVFLDCLRFNRHHAQVNIGSQIDSEGDIDEEEAA